MRGAHFEWYFHQDQNRRLSRALSSAQDGSLPLPRFAAVLRRAENAWGHDGLPKAANRTDLENPARLCQYQALKLLYDRPFRAWVAACDAAALNAFLDRAIDRATKAARDLNARGDGGRAEFINAKAKTIGRLSKDERIEDFFFRLSAATASEMRVQRGYESDAESAREQAGYIEKLKADVVALAFRAYLKQAEFEFVLKLRSDAPRPNDPLCALDPVWFVRNEGSAERWQKDLYFLIHLAPVEEIGKLLHQLRKWEILASPEPSTAKEKVRRIQSALELYLDMHDAKFEGGEALVGVEPFRQLFRAEQLFDRVFERPAGDRPGANDDRRVPRRGLREIMRFGHLRPLLPVFEKRPIRDDEVAKYFEAEQARDGAKSEIARNQELRERLHEKWALRGSEFSDADRRGYEAALKFVVEHRHLAARVTLTDHVRLHRLLMSVLGRLLDYSGLWERDLYFTALALLSDAGRRPEDAFAEKGLAALRDGQIVEALRGLTGADAARDLAARLERHFGKLEKSERPIAIRNGFAHFNMLRPNRSGDLTAPDLTACVNDARELMAYDRKLKNAVSGSVAEMLGREGLEIAWTATGHALGTARVRARQVRHLGRPHGSSRLLEDLHGDDYVGMVADLFGGAPGPRPVAQPASAKSAREGPHRADRLRNFGSSRYD